MAATCPRLALLALVALTAAACGGGGHEIGEPGLREAALVGVHRHAQADRGARQARRHADREDLPGTVKIGHAFVKRIRLLEPPAADKATARKMVQQFGYYFDGLAIGYAVLTKRKSQGGFVQTVSAAVANQRLAERYATKLGAAACAREPFE